MATVSEIIRRFTFWQLDKFKGGHIRSHYKNVRYIMENCNTGPSAQLRNKQLSCLLEHARQTTQFYRNVPENDLKYFPVINKNLIRENSESFTSADINFNTAKSVVTSGSTGTPFSLKHDKRKSLRNTADTIYFGELSGFKIGQRLYYFKIWNRVNRKSKLLQFTQNIIPCDVSKLDDQTLPVLIDKLKKDRSNKGLLAYSSVYDAIGQYMQNNDLSPIMNHTKSVIAMSEALNSSSKQTISKYFNTNAVSRYSNMENGIIAQQMNDGSEEFIINEASYFVELLDLNSDLPAPDGFPGRIVITDLYNFCMPMIRYDTGDIGTFAKKDVSGESRTILKTIEGRRMDLIYNTSGSLMSSYIITNNMWKYKEIQQYQFIQNSADNYKFLLNTEKPFHRSEELIAEFKEYLGGDANITVEYVHEIPVLSSGKRRKVVNNYRKQ